MQTLTLHIRGMACAGCSNTVMQALQSMPGVEKAEVSFSEGLAHIDFDPETVTQQQLESAVMAAGYQLGG